MSLLVILKLIHVLAAITAVGANLTYTYWMRYAGQDRDRLIWTMKGIRRLDNFIATPAYVVLLITGVLMVIGGVEGLAERAWPGRRLRIGEMIIEAVKLRGRCVMATFDPDTLVQDLGVLRRIAQVFDGRMALDSAVVRGGRIAIGDPVELVEPDDINSPAASSTSRPAARLPRRA